MKKGNATDPNGIYQKPPDGVNPLTLFVSPSQYVQGRGVIGHLGAYLSVAVSGCAGVLITPGRDAALGALIDRSLKDAGFTVKKVVFQGESSLKEAARVADLFEEAAPSVGVCIGVGGGKCLDTARMAASRLGVPAVTVPTTASTDAPTAAHAVVYRDDGVFSHIEFCATNPLLVLADLDVIAAAPARYLIAGMGDAFSTFYEARCCAENLKARTTRGGRPTMAALAIARQCREALLENGTEALKELGRGRPGEAMARIVEANILLSGLGFESGGLAGAHGVAQGLTAIEDLHANCLHGELVAIGTMAQLVLEKRMDEAAMAARFFKDVGLPLHLARIGFDPRAREKELDTAVETSLGVFFLGYEPFEITHASLKAAILEADEFGRRMERGFG